MLRHRSARPSDAGAPALLRRRRRERSRGQSLVEFALVIPVLLLLTLIALDFGRVYLGYINLQNMARIAANFAANNPTAWGATPDAAVQLKYKNQIVADAAAINCALPKVAGVTVVPAPVFKDKNGNGKTTDLGDTAEVQIGCTFGVITPGIANIVGGTVQVGAASSFPVKSGMTASGSGGGSGGSPPNAAFSGNGEITPNPVSGVAPFTVDFRDTSGGNPTSWLWTFSDGSPSSTLQDPLLHTFNAAGTYIVKMVATNVLGSTFAEMGVTVTAASTVNFTADQTTGNAPLPVIFTDTSTPGGTAYAWTFGDGGTSTSQNPSYTYNTSGTYTVALTVTYAAPTGAKTETKTGFITVSVAQCLVPSLNGVRFNSALAVWRGAPYNFTGNVIRGPGAPNGNFTITAQDRTAGSTVACTSDVTVNRP